jgi:hypothetical protein
MRVSNEFDWSVRGRPCSGGAACNREWPLGHWRLPCTPLIDRVPEHNKENPEKTQENRVSVMQVSEIGLSIH